MADIDASDEGGAIDQDGNCSGHCDKQPEPKDILTQETKFCGSTLDTECIKTEADEESCFDDCPETTPGSMRQYGSDSEDFRSKPVCPSDPEFASQNMISSCKIKAEASPLSPGSTDSSPMVIHKPLPQDEQKINMGKPLPLMAAPRVLCQPKPLNSPDGQPAVNSPDGQPAVNSPDGQPEVVLHSLNISEQSEVVSHSLNISEQSEVVSHSLNISEQSEVVSHSLNISEQSEVVSHSLNISEQSEVVSHSLNISEQSEVVSHSLNIPDGQPEVVSHSLNISGQPEVVSQPLHIPDGQPAVVSPPLHFSQIKLPVQTPSPKYHNATKKLTASEILRQRARKKKTLTSSTPTVRTILPKALPISDTDVNGKGKNGNSSDHGPKIERVFYTSRREFDQFGQIKVAENALHPPPLTKEFKLVHSKLNCIKNHQNYRKVLNPAVRCATPSTVGATVVQAQTAWRPNMTVTTTAHQTLVLQTPQHKPHSVAVSYALSQTGPVSVNTPAAVLPAALSMPRFPNSFLSCPQTVLSKQQTVVPDCQNGVQQMLPQNMVLVKPAQGGAVLNSQGVRKKIGQLLLPGISSKEVAAATASSDIKIASPSALGSGSGIKVVPSASCVVGSGRGIQIVPPVLVLGSNLSPASSATFTAPRSSPAHTIHSAPSKLTSKIPSQHHNFSEVISSCGTVLKTGQAAKTASQGMVTLAQERGGKTDSASSLQGSDVLTGPGTTRMVWLPSSTATGRPTLALFPAAVSSSGGNLPVPVPTGPLVTETPLSPSLSAVRTAGGTSLVALPPSASVVTVLPTVTPSQRVTDMQKKLSTVGTAAVACGGVAQKQPSNIVLLPPMTAQGYLLNGIHMEGPKTVQSTDGSNACHGVHGTPAMEQGLDIDCHVSSNDSLQGESFSEEQSENKDLALKSQVSCGETIENREEMTESAEKATGGKSSALSLMFRVKGGASHCTAAQLKVIQDEKVAELAKELLSSNKQQHCPHFVEDGRVIFPITYTGPYVHRNTKTVVRGKDSNLLWMADTANRTASIHVEGSMESARSSLQSIPLYGRIVWLFLDYEGPEIIWKLEVSSNQVLALPLDSHLPRAVLTEIKRMVWKYHLILPPAVDPFHVEPEMKNKVETNNQLCVLKEKTHSCGSSQHFEQCPNQQQMISRKCKWSGHETGKTSSSASTNCLQSEELPQSSSDSHRAQGSMAEPARKHAWVCSAAGANTRLQKEGEGRGCAAPQLMVRERAEVVQRALEAVVCLERLPLTEHLQLQLNSEGQQNEGSQRSQGEDGQYHKTSPPMLPDDIDAGRPLALHHAERLQQCPEKVLVFTDNSASSAMHTEHQVDKSMIENMSLEKGDNNVGLVQQREHCTDSEMIDAAVFEPDQNVFSAALKSNQADGPRTGTDPGKQDVLVENEDCRESKEWTEMKQTDNQQEERNMERRKRAHCQQEERNAKRRKGTKKERFSMSVTHGANRLKVDGGVQLEREVRRSNRIFCQPQPNYLKLVQGYDDLEGEIPQASSKGDEKTGFLETSSQKGKGKLAADLKLTTENKRLSVGNGPSTKVVPEYSLPISQFENIEECSFSVPQPDCNIEEYSLSVPQPNIAEFSLPVHQPDNIEEFGLSAHQLDQIEEFSLPVHQPDNIEEFVLSPHQPDQIEEFSLPVHQADNIEEFGLSAHQPDESNLSAHQPDNIEESSLPVHQSDNVEEGRGQGQVQLVDDQATKEKTSDNGSHTFLLKHKDKYIAMMLTVLRKSPDSETDDSYMVYRCLICEVVLQSVEELVAHLKKHHRGELVCQTCQFHAACKQELTEHEALEHTGKPLYHCPVCHRPFFSQTVFNRHLKRHEIVHTWCPQCQLRFPSRRELDLHRVIHHALDSNSAILVPRR